MLYLRNVYYSAVHLKPLNMNFPCENLKILINLALVCTDYAYMFFSEAVKNCSKESELWL